MVVVLLLFCFVCLFVEDYFYFFPVQQTYERKHLANQRIGDPTRRCLLLFFFLFENSGVAAVARFENFPNQRDHEDSNGRMTFDLKIF